MKCKTLLFLISLFILTITLSCSSDDVINSPIEELNTKIQGNWLSVAYSGGLGGFPETPITDEGIIEFTSNNIFKVYKRDELTTELVLVSEELYTIIYKKSSINNQFYYFLSNDSNTSLSNIYVSISEERLIINHDVVDGMTFYYTSF